MVFYRGDLPHVRVDGGIYFVTWRCARGQSDLSESEKDMVGDVLWWADDIRYRLHAYVIMNDHIHVIVEPFSNWPLEKLIQSWKSYTANRFQRRRSRYGRIWQDEYFDRIVRDEIEYWQKRDYILRNPYKRWPSLSSYAWVWAVGFPHPERERCVK